MYPMQNRATISWDTYLDEDVVLAKLRDAGVLGLLGDTFDAYPVVNVTPIFPNGLEQ